MNELSPRLWSFVRLAALVLVAAAFAVAGALKLADPARFAVDIGNYRLVPPLFAAVLALYLPWLELTLAVGLLVPRLRRAAAGLGIGLLAGFCIALASTLVRGLDIRCGCFGGAEGGGLSAGWALARNLLLIGLLAVASGAGLGRERAAGRIKSR